MKKKPCSMLHARYAMRFACLLLMALSLSGCRGYKLVGTGSTLPEHIKKIHIPYFKNDTERVEVEQRLTEEVQKEFNLRAKLDVVSSWGDADAVLEATVVKFTVRPVAFNANAQANRYEVTVQVSAKLMDIKANTPLWENSGFVFRTEYESAEAVQDYVNMEITAIDEIAKSFAQTLVATITQGF